MFSCSCENRLGKTGVNFNMQCDIAIAVSSFIHMKHEFNILNQIFYFKQC